MLMWGGSSLHFWHRSHCTQLTSSLASLMLASFFLFFLEKPSPITTSCFAMIRSFAFWAAARPERATGTVGGALGVTGPRGVFGGRLEELGGFSSLPPPAFPDADREGVDTALDL